MIGLRKRVKQRPNIVKTQKRRDPLQNGFMSLFFEVHLVKKNKQGKQGPKVKYKNKYQLDKGDKHFEDIEFGKQGDRDVVSGKKR
ncbi:hypothetical protein FA11_0496 [Pelosinus fermentans A11]|nr:hypothetical protein FA11_0496 [Pelosinus fermentans A11]